MTIDLKAIRAAAEAATKGNWRITTQGKHVVSVDSGRICASPEHMVQWNWDANAKHIATANPATVIALLDRLEAAEKEIQLVRNAALEEAAKVCEVNHHTVRPSPDSFECAAGIRSLKS